LLVWAVSAALGTRHGPPPAGLDQIDWDAVVRLAVDHGVMPLLYRCASDQLSNQIPSIVQERLACQYAANEIEVQALRAELVEVLAAMADCQIRALPLKGPVLAQWLYAASALRQSGDLDIFVAPEHVERAREVLRRRGYVLQWARDTD